MMFGTPETTQVSKATPHVRLLMRGDSCKDGFFNAFLQTVSVCFFVSVSTIDYSLLTLFALFVDRPLIGASKSNVCIRRCWNPDNRFVEMLRSRFLQDL